MTAESYYDVHKATSYSQLHKELPAMRYVEQHSMLHYIGDVKGKTVLDLACGNGIYTRIMKKLGATQAVGVDLSDHMITIAKKKEEDNPIGCNYHIADVKTMGKMGEFDLITAAFLLVYAENIDQLIDFGRVIYDNLKPGGNFVGINTNSMSNTFWNDTLKPFGVIYIKDRSIPGGTRFKVTWPGAENATNTTSVINYYYKPEIYEKVFKDLGFSEFSLHDVLLSEEGKQTFPKGFWDAYMANPPGMIIKAKK